MRVKKLYNTSDGQDRSISYIGVARYDYKSRYVLNLNVRDDGADVIGNKNQFTPLWSAGARYNVHNEPFFVKGFVSELSFRGSYGFTGQIDRSAYPFSIIELSDMMYMGNRFVDNYDFPNPTVKWARKKDFNLGLELGMINNRLFFMTDWYKNRTTDILSELFIPWSTGRNKVRANGGIVENNRLEFSLRVNWIENKDWLVSTRFNIAKNSNKIIKAHHNYETYEELIRSNPIQGGVVDLIGEETRAVYGWKTAGVNPKTGNPRYYLSERGKEEYAKFLKNFNSLSPDKQEYYKGILPSLTEVPDVVDFDLSKSLSETWQLPSMQYLGGLNPKHVGGFNTYIKYKNFEFTTDWTFKTGHLVPSFNDYVNAPRNLSFTDPAFMEIGYSGDLAVSSTNRQRKYLNYWQLPGDETNVKRFLTSDMDLWSTLYSSDKYEKGDYLRLTNLSFSYRVNSKLLARYAIRNLQIGVNMRNLLTFTKYKGVDVATGQAFGYPVPREFNIKLSLGF